MDKDKFYSQNYAKDLFKLADKYDLFIKTIDNLSLNRFLDIGCGDGSFATVVKNRLKVKEVFGIDISNKAIKEANRKGIKGVCLDIDLKDLPFKDNFFDVIFCGEVIEHLYSPDHLLGESHRVLRQDGILLLTTPNLAAWFNRISLLFGFQPIFSDVSLKRNFGHLWPSGPFGHLRLYTLRSLKKLMEFYSFKIIKSSGIGINTWVGFGRKFPLFAKLANFIFNHPTWSSSIFITATKR